MQRLQLLLLLCIAWVGVGMAHQRGPAFVAGTTVVPVDVRVVDDAGRPVTDLRPSDFTVFEEGVSQRISVFSARAMEVPTGVAGTDSAANRVTVADRRVFLIVLGRGRLDVVSDGVAAAIRFVQQSVGPGDLLAVTAWNRATAFTADRHVIADVLSRYARAAEQIESDLTNQTQGLSGQFGDGTFGPAVQSQIDGVFAASPGPHSLPTMQRSRVTRICQALRPLMRSSNVVRKRGTICRSYISALTICAASRARSN
jgi:VWFA-related protein